MLELLTDWTAYCSTDVRMPDSKTYPAVMGESQSDAQTVTGTCA